MAILTVDDIRAGTRVFLNGVEVRKVTAVDTLMSTVTRVVGVKGNETVEETAQGEIGIRISNPTFFEDN